MDQEEERREEQFWEEWKREAQENARPDYDRLQEALTTMERSSRTLSPQIRRLQHMTPERIEALRQQSRREERAKEKKRGRRGFLVCVAMFATILLGFVLLLLLREAETDFITGGHAVLGILCGALWGLCVGILAADR